MFWYFSLFWGEIEPISRLKYCVNNFLCICVTAADCYFAVFHVKCDKTTILYYYYILFIKSILLKVIFFYTPSPHLQLFIWILFPYFISNKRNGKLLDVSSQYLNLLLYIYQRNLSPPRCIDHIPLKYIYCLRGLDLGFLLVLFTSTSS